LTPSAAMALDIYAGLFADDLDAVADRHDRAFLKLNADVKYRYPLDETVPVPP
jgi:hypothetical protein